MEIVQKIRQLLTLNTSTASLQRLANGKLALTYFSIGGIDSGVTVAYYVDDANRLQSMDISRLEQGQESKPVIEMTPVDPAVQMLHTQFSPLTDVASPEQLQQARDKTQHYLYKKKYVVIMTAPSCITCIQRILVSFWALMKTNGRQ
jgi:hypothetical protein